LQLRFTLCERSYSVSEGASHVWLQESVNFLIRPPCEARLVHLRESYPPEWSCELDPAPTSVGSDRVSGGCWAKWSSALCISSRSSARPLAMRAAQFASASRYCARQGWCGAHADLGESPSHGRIDGGSPQKTDSFTASRRDWH